MSLRASHTRRCTLCWTCGPSFGRYFWYTSCRWKRIGRYTGSRMVGVMTTARPRTCLTCTLPCLTCTLLWRAFNACLQCPGHRANRHGSFQCALYCTCGMCSVFVALPTVNCLEPHATDCYDPVTVGFRLETTVRVVHTPMVHGVLSPTYTLTAHTPKTSLVLVSIPKEPDQHMHRAGHVLVCFIEWCIRISLHVCSKPAAPAGYEALPTGPQPAGADVEAGTRKPGLTQPEPAAAATLAPAGSGTLPADPSQRMSWLSVFWDSCAAVWPENRWLQVGIAC